MTEVIHRGILAKQYNGARLYFADYLTGKIIKIIKTYSIETETDIIKKINDYLDNINIFEEDYTGAI